MTAIVDRGTLKTAITAKIIRVDKTAEYDEWIQNGEIELNDRLRLLQQEVSAPVSVTLTSGQNTATLPTRFLEPISLLYSDIEDGPKNRTIDQVRSAYTAAAGRPGFFAYSSAFVFERPADQTYTLKSVHYEKWALGSQDTDTNWLLTNDPFAYLYAALAAFEESARDPKNPPGYWSGLRDRRIRRRNEIDARSRKSAPLVTEVSMMTRSGRGYDIRRG